MFPGSLQPLAQERAFYAFLRPLFRNWVVYGKRPFGGPEHVLQYLARYTHRVAISNHRILSVADGKVTFRWKDYAHGSKQRKMTLDADEFLRASCSMSCRAGSSGFAFPVSSRIEVGSNFCRSVSSCWGTVRNQVRRKPKVARQSQPQAGFALAAAAP